MVQQTDDATGVGEPSDQWREYRGAPTGTSLECEGWRQEAALRMLNNTLDPEVAERPEDLVVYGGTGRAARSPLGTIREGAPADLVVLDAPSHVHVPYSYGVNRVATVLKRGEPVVGAGVPPGGPRERGDGGDRDDRRDRGDRRD